MHSVVAQMQPPKRGNNGKWVVTYIFSGPRRVKGQTTFSKTMGTKRTAYKIKIKLPR